MVVLVTGATGLIGNGIARALTRRGERVRALVRDPARARQVLPPEVELILADVTDAASLGPAVSGVDLVFHAAGLPEQWARDEEIFDRVNRRGTANVLRAALDAGVRRAVYTSTMDVFRKDADGGIREDQVEPGPKPTAYERSKQRAEREADRIRAEGLEVVFLNPAAVYGPTPTTTGMTRYFIRVIERKAPLLPPGGVSLAYAGAVAQAHVTAADRGRSGERYLLSDGFVTMRELAEMIARAAGIRRLPPVAPAWLLRAVAGGTAPLARAFGFTPPVAPSELAFLLWQARADASKARDELDYRPMPIEEGVRRTVEHLRVTGTIRG